MKRGVVGPRRPAADEVLDWPTEQLRPDLEWLLAMARPNRWTAGQLEYDAADTPEHRARLERLAAEPLLGLFASDFEVVEVRPCDVQQVPRLSRPRALGEPMQPQAGYEDLDPTRRFAYPARPGTCRWAADRGWRGRSSRQPPAWFSRSTCCCPTGSARGWRRCSSTRSTVIWRSLSSPPRCTRRPRCAASVRPCGCPTAMRVDGCWTRWRRWDWSPTRTAPAPARS